METKELNNLMIDDLVFYDGKPIKVENVHRNCINFKPDIPYVQEEFWINLTEIEPIPLTEEILKKNGFTDVGDGYYQNEEQCCGVYINTFMFYVYVNDYDDDECHDVAQVFNVHQLQHALRLVGLDEMADNLKV